MAQDTRVIFNSARSDRKAEKEEKHTKLARKGTDD